MTRHMTFYVFMFVLVVAGLLMGFGEAKKAGSALVFLGGVLAIAKSRSMAMAQNSINRATKKFTWNPWGQASQRLFVIWGVGMVIVGLLSFIWP